MPMTFATMTLSGLLMVAASSGVPSLDTRPTCAGAESDGLTSRTVAGCMQSEQQARDELASKWTNFPATDRHECVAQTGIGGYPSYVQVLVCLELARDARKMPKDY